MKKNHSLFLLPVVFCTTFLFACKTTIRTEIPVEFSTSTDSLSFKLMSLVRCEHINVGGIETKVNGKHTGSELSVEMINPADLPGDTDSQDKLTLAIARLLKPVLKHQELFETFQILFVFRKTDGAVTTTHYTGHTWKLSEI